MSAKSLGTLPVIYAADEQQNPLPRKTMLFEGDTNNTGGGNCLSKELRASAIDSTLYNGGRGLTIVIFAAKKDGVENSYHCMGVPRTFGRYCGYIKDVIQLAFKVILFSSKRGLDVT